MRGKVKIFGLERTLNGSSHHNKESRGTSCLRDIRVLRMICRHKECSQTSRRSLDELRPRSSRCNKGCCTSLGCCIRVRMGCRRCLSCRRLGCKLPNSRVRRIRDQSSKFRASRSFSRLRQRRRQWRSAQRRTMQSKLSTKMFSWITFLFSGHFEFWALHCLDTYEWLHGDWFVIFSWQLCLQKDSKMLWCS